MAMVNVPALKDEFVKLKTRMDKAVADFQTHMAGVRTGRANIHMLDNVKVDYYGSEMPLNQIAQVHAADAQMLTVQPFDPSSLPAIEKAVRAGDLGFNPQNDGKMIRIPVPPLTEDHRTAVRNIRRDGNDVIKKALKDKKVSEDEEHRALEEMQKLTDAEIKKMEDMSAGKEKEVMAI